MAFEQTFKNIDNALRTDEGCSSELDVLQLPAEPLPASDMIDFKQLKL